MTTKPSRSIAVLAPMLIEGKFLMDSLTDEELMMMLKYFKKLSEDLLECGPVMQLSVKAVKNVYYELCGWHELHTK